MSESHKRIASRIAAAGQIRTAGKIEFIRDQGPVRRDIRVEGYEWSPDALRNLAKILWAAQRSHSYASSALRLFSRMPSSQFSPDGLLGGRGYIQSIKDLRASIATAVETLSNFTDTVYDEINADHWSPAESNKSNRLIQDAESIKTNPDAFVEQEYREDEGDQFLSVSPTEMNPTPEDYGQVESSSSGSSEGSPGFSQQANELKSDLRKIRSISTYDHAFKSMLNKHQTRVAGGTSSIPVDTLSGPRVDHIGPGEGGEYGWFNGPEAVPSDDPSLSGFLMTDNPYIDPSNDGVTGYDNPTDGDITYLKKTAADTYSWLPGSSNDRLMPIYTPGLSAEEIEMMLKNAAPINPMQPRSVRKPLTDWLWEK